MQRITAIHGVGQQQALLLEHINADSRCCAGPGAANNNVQHPSASCCLPHLPKHLPTFAAAGFFLAAACFCLLAAAGVFAAFLAGLEGAASSSSSSSAAGRFLPDRFAGGASSASESEAGGLYDSTICGHRKGNTQAGQRKVWLHRRVASQPLLLIGGDYLHRPC